MAASALAKTPPVYVLFHNFWNGFIEKTDSMDCTFFITLLEKTFSAPIHITTSPATATVLVESIFGNNTYLHYKKWDATFLFTGESHYYNCQYIQLYDCVLGFEDTHDKYVKCPLYLLFLQTNPSILVNIKAAPTTVAPTAVADVIPPNRASVIISNVHGNERLQFMNRVERAMPVFFGGKYKNNVGGVVGGSYNSTGMTEFYKRGKFAITMENSDKPYYITEKLVNGLRSGVVPVYWGTSRIGEFFNPRRFLHLKANATQQDMDVLIHQMKTMTDQEYANIIREPIMTRSMEDVMDEIAHSIKKILT
jgi:hypothetical protein